MKVRLTATGDEMSSELEKYATGKAAVVAKHVPFKLRGSSDCWMHFAEVKKKGANTCSCTITFRVGDSELKAEESTQHMYAALDIAAVRIEQQIDDYVALQKRHPVRSRLKRRFGGEL